MLDKVKKTFDEEVQTFARNNIIKKLDKQGVNYKDVADLDFNNLLADEIEILKSDSKKIGVGVGIGILLSLVTGI